MAEIVSEARPPSFLSGGGAMGALMRARDWSTTPLGEPETWPQALKTTVRLALTTRHPMFIFWGPEHICLWNDAYSVSLGPEKYPAMLGEPGRVMWPEIWSIIGPQIELVMRGDGATWHENALVPILRNGLIEEVYWTYGYGPIDSDGAPGGVGGVLVICREVTDQVLAERGLASERERFSRLFSQAPTFMAVLSGPEHRFEQVNPAYLKLIGHRDVIGKTVAEAVPEAVGQGYIRLLDDVFQTGKAFTSTGAKFAIQVERGGGLVERYLDFVYDAMRDRDGNVTGVFVVGHDVTDQAAAVQALAASEARFRLFAQAMPNQAWSANAGGLLTWFNDKVYDYSGAVPGELDGDGWAGLVHPDDIAQAADNWARAVAAGDPYETQFRIRRRDGEYRWHIVRALPLRDDHGAVTLWTGTNTDIQAQKRITDELLASERRLRLSQAAAQIGSLELDIVSTLVIGTDKLWEIWGLPPQPAGAPLAALSERVLAEDRHVISTPETRSSGTVTPVVEFRIRRADTGAIRWLSRHVEFAMDSEGRPSKMFGVMQDITDRKEAEARRQVLTHELEHRIKNILSMVSAIASQTLRNADIRTASASFNARLRALSDAHDILTKAQWEVADLAEVISATLAPLQTGRADIIGPRVLLPPKMALSMALAINELATNALKYGAFSNADGRATVSWTTEAATASAPGRLSWSWIESGGPPVVAPRKRGFGSILIEKVLAADFDGKVRIEYEREGVACYLEAPLPVRPV